jgi:translation initiation factor IF-2
MSDKEKSIRLLNAAKELNIGKNTIIETLKQAGFTVEDKPTTKLSEDQYNILLDKFQKDRKLKQEASKIHIGERKLTTDEAPSPKFEPEVSPEPPAFEPEREILIKDVTVLGNISSTEEAPKKEEKSKESLKGPTVVGKVDLDSLSGKKKKTDTPKKEEKPVEKPKAEKPVVKEEPKAIEPTKTPAPEVKVDTPKVEEPEEVEVIRAKAESLTGVKVMGNIDITKFEKPKKEKEAVKVGSSTGQVDDGSKKKRKRKDSPNQGNNQNRFQGGFKKPNEKGEAAGKQVQEQVKQTLAKMQSAGKPSKFAKSAKFRKDKRNTRANQAEESQLERELNSRVLKVTEFVTANELAKMMDIQVNRIIATCLGLGLFISINQRLDADTIKLLAEDNGFDVEFVTVQAQDAVINEEDKPEDLKPRAPIVTVMGHVDHGKTSLLDFVRKANVISGEAGGITQHIGAYEVVLENGKKIAFLDTPGHEAFTAMRARGAKITDVVIIVIAADDSVMPQTIEAINHAQAAGVPIVFAFNKIDKPGANPDKIREQLAGMNILVEDWGGKYQSQEIAAKSGLNIDLLLEKVLLEAELLDLKANPDKRAQGGIIEAALDKGKGIVATVMVQSGTLRVGDPILAGPYSGRVKALYNERGAKINEAGPSTPVVVLGFDGAPQAGDSFHVMNSESEAREIANKRLQLIREQGLRTSKHITLDEIGRRLAVGTFKELNLIVKGDVDGSVEALADSLLKLSNDEIQVNVVHIASDAIIIGFQVRPSVQARKAAEVEEIDIRLYSIIYDAINEVKLAMEGLLAPTIEEKITSNVEIREVFKISKVGTIAGCMVLDGKINRNSRIRLVRDGVVIYTGELASLKRFKDDVKEVATGYECGLNIQNYNDIKVGDIVESFEEVEIKRKLNL